MASLEQKRFQSADDKRQQLRAWWDEEMTDISGEEMVALVREEAARRAKRDMATAPFQMGESSSSADLPHQALSLAGPISPGASTTSTLAHHSPTSAYLGRLPHITDSALDACVESLKPPPGTVPSVGDWDRYPGLLRPHPPWRCWFDLGEAMVATEGLPMMRGVGTHSLTLLFGAKVGAPLGTDGRVDAAWLALSSEAHHRVAVDDAVERVMLYKMGDAPEARRASADRELRQLLDWRTGFAQLRRFAREFWRDPAPLHPRDTPVCWAWCALHSRRIAQAPLALHTTVRAQGRVDRARAVQRGLGGLHGAGVGRRPTGDGAAYRRTRRAGVLCSG